MAGVFKSLAAFKKAKDKSLIQAGSGGTLKGIKHTVIVPVPGDLTILTRSRLLDRLVKLVGDPHTRGSKLTGVLMGILSLFVESPSQLIQRITDDPDISIKLVEVVPSDMTGCRLTFASRGASLDREAEDYFNYMSGGLSGNTPPGWFEERDVDSIEVDDAEQFTVILSSVLAQIWILLAKAVTAPDTAAESENRRWIKYTQQRRVVGESRLNKAWLDSVRGRIAEDLSLRRFMVFLILDIKRIPGCKPRIAEMVCDIDNYIVEAGLASFVLTIKFGIETMYPALGLHEFRGELSIIESLMKLYQDMGEGAPYMVILENSLQNKFSAGSYPLLWSYAMGVGVELEGSMGGLNFGRSYFDPTYFRLGQEMVRRSAGKVSSSYAREMGITPEEAQLVEDIIARGGDDRGSRQAGPRQTHITFLQSEDSTNKSVTRDWAGGEERRGRNLDSAGSWEGAVCDETNKDISEDNWGGETPKDDIGVPTEPEDDTRSKAVLEKMKAMVGAIGNNTTAQDPDLGYNDKALLA